jgi:hypothetical protein
MAPTMDLFKLANSYGRPCALAPLCNTNGDLHVRDGQHRGLGRDLNGVEI